MPSPMRKPTTEEWMALLEHAEVSVSGVTDEGANLNYSLFDGAVMFTAFEDPEGKVIEIEEEC